MEKQELDNFNQFSKTDLLHRMQIPLIRIFLNRRNIIALSLFNILANFI